MRKDSVYLPDLECYTETVCLFTRFGVLYRNFQPNKLLCTQALSDSNRTQFP
jgi:hypothetical protein